MTLKGQVCGFKMGGDFYSLRACAVEKVEASLNFTPIPLSEDFILGVGAFRGNIIAGVDLSKLLGAEGAHGPVIVVAREGHYYGLAVEKMVDIFAVDEGTVEGVPEVLQGSIGKLATDVHKYQGRLFVHLDLDSILHGRTS